MNNNATCILYKHVSLGDIIIDKNTVFDEFVNNTAGSGCTRHEDISVRDVYILR